MPFKFVFLIFFAGGNGSLSLSLIGGFKIEGSEEWSNESVFGFFAGTSFNSYFFEEFRKTMIKNTPIPIFTASF